MKLHTPVLILVFAFQICSHAQAGSLGAQQDAEAQSSAVELRKTSDQIEAFAHLAQKAWVKKCGESEEVNCHLEECDLSPTQCRPQRILLFRGESGKYPTPSISGLVRTHWSTSNYAQGDVSTLLAQLKSDFQLLRPMTAGPDEGDRLTLVRDGTSAKWYYKDSDITFEPAAGAALSGLSLMNMIFTLHAQAAFTYYHDPKLNDVPLDPLVSYSYSPTQALRFSEGLKGMLIVASVPERDLVRECGENLPAPGSIFDPSACSEVSQFTEEAEVDAFLYLAPLYVWKSFFRGP